MNNTDRDNEHLAWLDIFEEMSSLFKLSREQLNDLKYRRLFTLIERWAYFDRIRRKGLENPEGCKGIFYNGEGL